MKNRTLLNTLVAMLVVVVLFGVAQTAAADPQGTENFYVWDRSGLSFNNSVADIYFDGSFVEVFSRLAFDSDLYTTVAEDASACGVGASTSYAGRIALKFDHEDANPAGALGMKESQAWQLVDCDFDNSGTIDAADRNVDLGANPPDPWVADGELTLITIDEVVATTGNTDTKIVTTMFVNLDNDCDNSLADETLPTGGVVCFFAQGVTPTLAEAGPPYWNNANLQASFETGGEKTVNLKVYGPTAITLEDFGAQSLGNVHPAVWLTIFLLLGAITFVLIRERTQGSAVSIRKEE